MGPQGGLTKSSARIIGSSGGASADSNPKTSFSFASALGFHYFCFSLEPPQLLRHPGVKDIENT